VRLIIQNHEWLQPSNELVAHVREVLDPPLNTGRGMGLAPIGHRVTVAAARGVAVNVSADFTLAQGWQFDNIKADLEGIVGEYLRELAALWSQTEFMVVRAAQIEARLLNEAGGRVVDIAGLSLNGGVSGRNITLSAMEFPVGGVVTNVA
jgi:uncharacterized phage protein gp47/JayE